MVKASRIIYLLVLGSLIGLAVVHWRTQARQAIHESIGLDGEEQRLRSELWEQRVRMSALLESPVRIKEQVDGMGLEVAPAPQ